MRKRFLLISSVLLSLSAMAVPVKVTMNATSTTMSLVNKSNDATVDVGTPANRVYSFDAAPGKYLLTAYASNGTTVNGTIELDVTDSTDDQNFTVITCGAYVSNKTGSTTWSVENGDYTFNVTVNTREGDPIVQTPGVSTTAGRQTFLALNGNSYQAAFEPSEEHKQEGYMTLYKGGTLTGNINVYGAIPMAADYSIEVPADAEWQLGMKFTHFTDFTPIQPTKVENADGGKKYYYTLADGQVYNYRTWKTGGLTHGGYFTMSSDAAKRPEIKFTDADYAKHDPKAINHSAQSNKGYETGDLLLNINKEHYLKLNVNDEFLVHGMRMWELSDNSTNNYFFEPDLHYTVLDENFKPSSSVIEIENADTNTSAWSNIKAKAPGTAIVLVTYDGINLNYYSGANKNEYLGGEYWGAIWPENTGVFVVTVGQDASSADPNMVVNEKYNTDALKMAGKYVDAEHDVFYYLDTEEGFRFTFTPQNVESVSVASPVISETAATYTGFSSDNVVKNEDGSYTILLKKGRNIIKLTDAAGNATYQVLKALPCHREITNATRPGSKIFQPGDKIKIQFDGLYHPANKIAGIYNMSAYVTYNGTPNGSSLILGAGQYNFGSAASAQAVTLDIPADYNVEEKPQIVMNEGVIQVNGFGDPIGNHRNISPIAGRSPNFTAVAHKTYFGSIPDITIDLSAMKEFQIKLAGAPESAKVVLSFDGKELQPDESGVYTGTYGSYSIVATADGYRCFRQNYQIGDDAEGPITFNIDMAELDGAWDGKTKTEPSANADGIYEINTPAELAWFADNVNGKGENQKAVLNSDIHLGNFDWTPIGSSNSNLFSGNFDGSNHKIAGLYVASTANYKGLFGYMKDGNIKGITVDGSVSGKQYIGGIVGYVAGTSSIENCANEADVTGMGTYVGGITGYLSAATCSAANLYNTGHVTGTTNCGGVIGSNNKDAEISNIFNVGEVTGTTVGGCVGGTTAKTNLTNAFTTSEYGITEGQTLVSAEQMASGEVAYKLGDAFFQTIGVDAHPSFSGLKVYYDEADDSYYNLATSFAINLGEGTENIVVNEDELTLCVNDSYQLTVTPTPETARLPELAWKSSDIAIVSVDNDGLIHAIAVGDATVSASAMIDDKEQESACRIKVIADSSAVEGLWNDSAATVDIYDIDGRIIKTNADIEYYNSLPAGIYVIKSNSVKTVVLK